jgi:hypothetical protein
MKYTRTLSVQGKRQIKHHRVCQLDMLNTCITAREYIMY